MSNNEELRKDQKKRQKRQINNNDKRRNHFEGCSMLTLATHLKTYHKSFIISNNFFRVFRL